MTLPCTTWKALIASCRSSLYSARRCASVMLLRAGVSNEVFHIKLASQASCKVAITITDPRFPYLGSQRFVGGEEINWFECQGPLEKNNCLLQVNTFLNFFFGAIIISLVWKFCRLTRPMMSRVYDCMSQLMQQVKQSHYMYMSLRLFTFIHGRWNQGLALRVLTADTFWQGGHNHKSKPGLAIHQVLFFHVRNEVLKHTNFLGPGPHKRSQKQFWFVMDQNLQQFNGFLLHELQAMYVVMDCQPFLLFTVLFVIPSRCATMVRRRVASSVGPILIARRRGLLWV